MKILRLLSLIYESAYLSTNRPDCHFSRPDSNHSQASLTAQTSCHGLLKVLALDVNDNNRLIERSLGDRELKI